MAVTNPIAPFLWGQGGVAMSPEQVAREREIAALLMQQGDPAFKDAGWLGILGRGLEGGLSGWKERQADEAERAGREGFQSQLDSVFGGGTSPVASALAGGSPASGGSFIDALVNSESGGNWQALNSEGYGGRLQFGQDRLADAAAAGVIPAGMTGADFAMMPPDVQQAVEQWHFNDIEQQAANMGLTQYYGQTIAGVPITPESVKAMAHLGGIGGAAKFITSGGQYNPADSNGTRLSDYGRRFGGASAAPAQVAQGPDMAALLGLAGNQWANPQQQAVVQALMGQQIQQQDPMYQLHRQKAELELEAMRNPAAPAPVWQGGQWWDISSGTPTALTEAAPSTSFNTITIDVPGVGPQTFNTADPAQYQMANQLLANGATEVKTPGVSVSVGGNNDIGTIPQGMMVTRDEAGNVTGMVPIPGGPAAIEAELAAAAAESGAASSAVGAASTATDARAVLDILDNAQTPATGTLSIPFAAYSGSDAGRIRSYVSTLQSGVALGAMQRLKEASATGATGFGALSAPELNLLISEIGALNPDNTEPDIFRATIERINERSKRVARDIMRNVEPSRIQELGLQPFLETVLGDELQKPQAQPNTTSSGVTWSIVD